MNLAASRLPDTVEESWKRSLRADIESYGEAHQMRARVSKRSLTDTVLPMPDILQQYTYGCRRESMYICMRRSWAGVDDGYLNETRKMGFDNENDSTKQHIKTINSNCSPWLSPPPAGLPLLDRSIAIVSH